MIWGILMAIVGLLMLIWGITRSEFVIDRTLAERSRSLWGDNVHQFYQVSGVTVFIVGVLLAFGLISAT